MRADWMGVLGRGIDRLVSAWMHRMDQYEAQDLLYSLPASTWGVGAAQVFSEVSPAMHAEFALQYEARWFRRFKHAYYGCCEPLHDKIGILREYIPNLRKVSMSPWVKFDRAVANIGSDLIFAWKPNPAMLATPSCNPVQVRRYLVEHLGPLREANRLVEIHLKDLSTVQNQPERLTAWLTMAREVVGELWP